MAILEVKKAGDPILKAKAKPVGKFDAKLKQFMKNMAETMYAKEGVGLAAPQIGVSLRIVVIDVGEGLIELINPEIVKSAGSGTFREGCLSVPEIMGDVKRYSEVKVEGLDSLGKKITVKGSGLLAICLQHEIDHLDGILFIDRAEVVFKLKQES